MFDNNDCLTILFNFLFEDELFNLKKPNKRMNKFINTKHIINLKINANNKYLLEFKLSNLKYLNCRSNQLTKLPDYKNLEYLDCRSNQLPYKNLSGFVKSWSDSLHII